MIDSFGREIDYLRISITDRCNLRCKYCMPNGIEAVPMEEILSYEEIIQVVEAAAELGIKKLKITGGEPLVRKGCISLIEKLKQIPGVEEVTITTNGVLLQENLNGLIAAGVDGINVSLDTMDSTCYQKITGFDAFTKVFDALVEAVKRNIRVKVNAVSLSFDEASMAAVKAGRLPNHYRELIDLAKEYPIDVRFIEMMPIGYGKDFPSIPHDLLDAALKNEFAGLKEDHKIHGNGPAVYYQIDGYQGSVGLISAIHGKFCDRCNRIRLTSKGELKSCLCYDAGVNLLSILRTSNETSNENEDKKKILIAAIEGAISEKPMQHCFEKPEGITESKNMISIGG